MPRNSAWFLGACGWLALAFAGPVHAAPFAAPNSAVEAESEDEDTDASAAEPPPAPVVERPGPLVRRGAPRPRDAAAPLRACSFRRALCVHAAAGAPADVLGALASAERAWDAAIGPLGLPAPDPDPSTRAYDVYLVDGLAGGADTSLGERDPRGGFDRASAFTRVDGRLTGCARDRAIARELLRAIVFRVSPARDDASARAQTTSLAELVVPCAPVDASLFQSHPERPWADAWPGAPPDVGARFGEGAALVYDWLDATYAAAPGALVRALWALTPTMTPLDAWRWNDEPDTFDVLRVTFNDNPARARASAATIDNLYREIGVARALMPPRPRIDWSLDWPAAPRRIASTSGVQPTGAVYVEVNLAGAPGGARLRLEAEWEQGAKMRWTVLKLDAEGRATGQLATPTAERATEAQMTIVDLEGIASVLLVGVNAGDPSYPFDPDDEIWEPHGWLLTLAAE
jgi:hypothetical protein